MKGTGCPGPQGRADLASDVDKSSKNNPYGNYELVNGSYNLTLSVLQENLKFSGKFNYMDR
jgi:hypothetical protein